MAANITYQYGQNRRWEIVPGVFVWATLVLAIGLSFIAPFWVVVFVIVFDLYWLFRVVYFIFHLLSAWRQYRHATRVDWFSKLGSLPRATRIHHLIFLPTYQEELNVVRPTLEALQGSVFSKERMIVVLAGEKKDEERFRRVAHTIEKEFGHVFGKLIVTVHPSGQAGEIPGKGSNLAYAARETAKILARDLPQVRDEDVIVSAFDIDTIAHPQYFANLTYVYCTVKNPERASYQPVALFSNNIWTSPAPVRIAAFGTTFWLMSELARPERLWTFSSHSMPWTMLKDVGFWQTNVVSEDSRIFLQGFLHYHGDYRVEPIFLPVSLDTVTGKNYWQALMALYKQQRRWAWGVEHLPVMMDAFHRDPTITRWKKFQYVFNHLEGMYTWATAPVLIFALGWLPLLFAPQGDALIAAAPFTLRHLMQLAMVGVLASGVLSLTMLPPRPKDARASAWFVMIAQWALLPVTFIMFGALPAIDAQTRLMIGKYLGFNVTKKSR